jgi:hypothetical protein
MAKKSKEIKAAQTVSAELVDVASLKPHPSNYRKHGSDQLAHIVKSIQLHGFYKNVVVAKDYTILAGHGAVDGAKALKIKKIPVVRLMIDPMDKRALKVLTGDNEIARLGEVDDRALSEILRDIAIDAEGLLGTGFDEKQLANLVFVTRHSDEIESVDAAREWIGLPTYDAQDDTKGKEPIIVISFANDADRDKFIEETKLQIRDKRGSRKWSTIWPYQERNDLKSVKFEDRGK